MAFPELMERCPVVGYPVPLGHAQKVPVLRPQTVRVLAREAEQCPTVGRLFLYLAASRSFDRNWHPEDCSVYSVDM